MLPQTVYLGHDNSINLQLTADGAPFPLDTVTGITLIFGGNRIESDNGASDPIRWLGEGYLVGEVRLFLGGLSILPGTYTRATFIVYLPPFTDGIVWESFTLKVLAEI
jgi:hypothetical protein